MPRNPTTGVFTRVSNSFSDPISGTVIDPNDAAAYYADIDNGLTNAMPKEPTVLTANGAISAGTPAAVIQKAAPSASAFTLPSVTLQNGIPLTIVDWSTGVTAHTITLTPAGAETIMQAATFTVYSNSAQLGSVTLYPSTTLNGWYV
ncbi:hypothetical protein [Tardiphaga sp. 709]|uniref:hypothetical protein n=1 Tax=Tardiphaga sp. 709 TaxID=3076039 RepID=UPI0028F15C45|nr:hypothetical protein [Tardiphaga sp. 709]WNV09948.1 hypothetical protein RSO67_01765 [Tardiphaga sp. 709]